MRCETCHYWGRGESGGIPRAKGEPDPIWDNRLARQCSFIEWSDWLECGPDEKATIVIRENECLGAALMTCKDFGCNLWCRCLGSE